MDTDPWYKIATTIREARIRAGFSIVQFANELDVSRSTVHNWESGKPVPINRCAQIASVLSLQPEEVLRIHPYSALPEPEPEAEAHAIPPNLGRVFTVAAGLVIVVAAAMILGWSSARADCYQVGVGGGVLSGPLREAHEMMGGEQTIGCAGSDTYKWADAYVQDLQGGRGTKGALFSLDREHVYTLVGPAFEDWEHIAGGGTPEIAGVPIAPPVQCGPSIIIELGGGWDGFGAIVSYDRGQRYAWLPARFWTYYVENGGHETFGDPLRSSERSPNEVKLEFERVTLVSEQGGRPVPSEPTNGQPLDIEECDVLTWDQVLEAAGQRVQPSP